MGAFSGRPPSGKREEISETPGSCVEEGFAAGTNPQAPPQEDTEDASSRKGELPTATAGDASTGDGPPSWKLAGPSGTPFLGNGGEDRADDDDDDEEEEEDACGGSLSKKSRLTPSTSASSTSLSRSGADCPVSHLVTDWRDTPVSCARAS